MNCIIANCERDKETRIGYCLKHYKRWKRTGNPNVDNKLKHGYARHPQVNPEYRKWVAMKARCTGSNNSRYGARGIKVCNRWRESFTAFLDDMGPCPSGYTIERIDNDGDYEPGNVRWATKDEQQRNRRNNIIIEYNGENRVAAEVARAFGVSGKAFYSRLSRGWSVERAFTVPVKNVKRKKEITRV